MRVLIKNPASNWWYHPLQGEVLDVKINGGVYTALHTPRNIKTAKRRGLDPDFIKYYIQEEDGNLVMSECLLVPDNNEEALSFLDKEDDL